MNTKKQNLITLLISSGIAMLSLLVVYVADGFYPFGNGSVLALDLQSQYTPLLYRFYDVVTGQKNLFVDFHLGGGINLYTDTMTALLNPFNYVLLLFGRSRIYLAVNVLLILYAMAATMSACAVLNRLFPNSKRFYHIALGLAYGMSYFMAYQYEIINWLYIVVLFPWFFLALKKLLDGERPVCFTLLTAYILCNSLQLGIQLCMFAFVYSVTILYIGHRELSSDKLAIRNRRCLTLGLSVVSSILLSAPVTYPTFINLTTSARSDYNASIASIIPHHGLDNILERIFEISSPIVMGLMIYCLIRLRKNLKEVWKQNKSLIVCMIILVLTVIIEPANLLWHLGSYQCFPVRYGYTVLWTAALLVMNLIDMNSDDNVVNAKIISVLSVIVSLGSSFGVLLVIYKLRLTFAQAFATLDISGVCFRQTIILYILMGMIALSVCISSYCGTHNNMPRILIILLCAVSGMAWFMAILLPQSSQSRLQMQEAYQDMNSRAKIEKTSIYSGHVSDDILYPLNAALVTGEFSMTAYVPSGESREYVNAMSSLGYETPWISVYSTGGSELSDKLLGIEDDYYGALCVSEEEYNELYSIDDYKQLLEKYSPAEIIFDNRAGRAYVTLNEESDGYVLLPMSYMNGWKCEQGEITSHLGGFLAIRLNDTVKTLEITYSLPGFTVGSIMMLIGVIILIVLIFADYTSAGWATKTAGVVFSGVTYIFAVLVYIIPLAGMLVFLSCKAMGNDFSDYLVSSTKVSSSEPVLLSEQLKDDGLHVLIARNNLMLEKGVKITACDRENNSFRPSKIADGDTSAGSRWSSANDYDNNEHFIQVDFGNSKDISALKIYWERNNACNYAIESSLDGSSWTDQRHFDTAAVSDIQTEYFEQSFNCRYLRIHVYDVNKFEEDASLYYQNVSIQELEVYSTDCDNIIIPTPVLSSGYNREIPAVTVPEGYRIKAGGINYDNLINNDGKLANTIAPVNINLGYTLSYGSTSWDLTGFDITLPASDGTEFVAFPYKSVSCCEWKPSGGELAISQDTADDILARKSNAVISEKTDEALLDTLGQEGFEIEITDAGILINSSTAQGAIWAHVMLKDMVSENNSSLPCGTIRDYPEYAVRGFVIDVGRRPVSMDMLYTIMEKMSAARMNTLQIHLNDNAIIATSQYDGTVDGARSLYSGYRIESSITAADGTSLTSSDCYYTAEEFREFVRAAKLKGIDVVPEIDTPAHSMAITKLFPELGFSDNPELADTLDISKPQVLEFATELWREQLESENSAFADCNILHLGMDEFYGDNDAYATYLANLSKAVRKIAPDKKLRVWGSMTFKEVNPTRINKDIEVMVWGTMWDDPLTTYNNGFGIINCLNKDLYIIVDNATDRLDTEYLASAWEPNVFVDGRLHETLPKWSPKTLGACYSMWNDFYCNNMTGPSEDELISKFEEPLKIIADKLW